MIKQKIQQKDKQLKPGRILAAILLMLLAFTAAGCITSNEQTTPQTDAPPAGEANTPPVVNATEETPEQEPAVIATETPKPDSSESNVVFVTPTPRPTPKITPLDIPVELYNVKPEDIKMNVFYIEGTSPGDHRFEGEVEYLPGGKWITVDIREDGRGIKTSCGKNKLSFHHQIGIRIPFDDIPAIKERYRISVRIADTEWN